MKIESGSIWAHAKSRAFVPPSLDLENVGSGNICCNKGDVYVVKKTIQRSTNCKILL